VQCDSLGGSIGSCEYRPKNRNDVSINAEDGSSPRPSAAGYPLRSDGQPATTDRAGVSQAGAMATKYGIIDFLMFNKPGFGKR
jgi:hypothetical protein